jgi:transposase
VPWPLTLPGFKASRQLRAVHCSDIFGTGGRQWLNGLALPQPYAGKLDSLLRIADSLTGEIDLLEDVLGDLLAYHHGYHAIQACDGIGPILGAVIVAEIGDVTRFKRPEQLCSWAGLTPRHRESDLKVARGPITKQGSPILRWALIEAVQRVPRTSVIGRVKAAIIARRGNESKNIAKVAAARELLTLIFYGLRDGHIRCLSAPKKVAGPTEPPARPVTGARTTSIPLPDPG